jgi:hypothetical protein
MGDTTASSQLRTANVCGSSDAKHSILERFDHITWQIALLVAYDIPWLSWRSEESIHSCAAATILAAIGERAAISAMKPYPILFWFIEA